MSSTGYVPLILAFEEITLENAVIKNAVLTAMIVDKSFLCDREKMGLNVAGKASLKRIC